MILTTITYPSNITVATTKVIVVIWNTVYIWADDKKTVLLLAVEIPTYGDLKFDVHNVEKMLMYHIYPQVDLTLNCLCNVYYLK